VPLALTWAFLTLPSLSTQILTITVPCSLNLAVGFSRKRLPRPPRLNAIPFPEPPCPE